MEFACAHPRHHSLVERCEFLRSAWAARAARFLRAFAVIALSAWILNVPRLGAQALNPNLIVNTGAEASAGAPYFNTTSAPAGWKTTSNFTAIKYATAGSTGIP